MGIGFAVTFLLIGGFLGSDDAFVNPAAKSDVKKYILDKDRQTEVLDLMKTYEAEFKVSRKKEKKQEKSLEKLFVSHNSEMSEFQLVFDAYMQLRELRQLSYMEAVLKTKNILTDDEWTNLLAGIDGRVTVQVYEQDKLIAKIESSNEYIEEDLKKWIADDEKANQASLIMKEVNSSEVAILKKMPVFNYKEDGLLRNKNATEEDYKKAFKEYNRWWSEYFDLYARAYVDLSAVTTDKEWQIMKKYTKGMF